MRPGHTSVGAMTIMGRRPDAAGLIALTLPVHGLQRDRALHGFAGT